MARFEKGGPRPLRSGRRRGTPNKVSGDLREMILGALADVGGRAYLARQAKENPQAFLSLLGKVLPKEIREQVERARFEVLNYTGLDPRILDHVAHS